MPKAKRTPAKAAATATQPLPIAESAAAIAELLAAGDLLFAATDEVRAAAIAVMLGGLCPDALAAHLPASDALPGDAAPASPVNVGARVSALRRMRLAIAASPRRPIACITTGEALARAYPPPEAFAAEPPHVEAGMAADGPALLGVLEAMGYLVDERVDEPGEVAWRGQVLDVFPADAETPLRVEIVDGVVASVRTYDPADQRTTGQCGRRELGRVTEPPVTADGTTLLSHLPGARVAIEPGADARRTRFLALAADAAKRKPRRAVREVVGETAWAEALSGHESLSLAAGGEPPARFVEERAPMRAFARAAEATLTAGDRVAVLGSARDLRFLGGRIGKALTREAVAAGDWRTVLDAPTGTLLTLPVAIDRGFRRAGVMAVAAADLLGSRAERDDARPGAADTAAFAPGGVRIGDVVVHEDHGIGIVAGLEEVAVDETALADAIRLTYARDGVRLVPVAEAERIWRYGAEADAVSLDSLDGSSWDKRRGEIAVAIAESARGLAALAAARDATEAPVLEPDSAAYERFAAGFAFTETADQARAIEAVRADLASGRPMDRLVVGDVGYGKTEVALRAAAIAALAGRQVAIAAPTTVLARQHLESFQARFEGSGIVVAGLSRLSTAAEKRAVKAGLKDGSVRIVIGTGAVAAKGVGYADLGLVVIDEEQRFGAADKTRLRDLSAGHVLTLSATPIPRTLQAALIGLQQLSVIATPPARRQPIRTATGAYDAATVRAALLREKSRGGQSFVVVPRIEDMTTIAETLRTLVPELEVLAAHGRMAAAEIDGTMVRFGGGDGDVLLATNIIEAGLDVPRANTMVIWRADRFGLSQLHQLRGRVGRGNRRGQVLLLTESGKAIAPRTLKRLRTLEAFDRLGAGFAISASDLDMRGAGDLLGEAQAGHMKLIGIDLYQELLGAALREARGETVERWTPELHLGIEGRIPVAWIPDEQVRVTLYTRLARLADEAALDRFAEELEDRFGALPNAAATLLAVARVRVAARLLGIARIDAGPAAIALTPRRGNDALAGRAGLEDADGRLLLRERIAAPAARLERLTALLETL